MLHWSFPAGIRIAEGGRESVVEREFRVNVWDFGGQEIYHATHQFFLTKRSVPVCDERRGHRLRLLVGGRRPARQGYPLVVAEPQARRAQAVDLVALRARYPDLVGVVAVDLADNSGLAEAVGKIRRELESSSPHIGTPLPKTRRDVRVALEGDARDHIPVEEFFRVRTTRLHPPR